MTTEFGTPKSWGSVQYGWLYDAPTEGQELWQGPMMQTYQLSGAMPMWQPIETAPKDGTEIIVTGGELWDECGSPSFGGPYLVYWKVYPDDPLRKNGIWKIKAGFGEIAACWEPTHWMAIPPLTQVATG
jgi:hypothetical protein